MTYTTQQLQAMSDFEVNKALAEKLKLRCVHLRSGMVCYQMDFGGSMAVDYCNNPNDIMPLAFERRIGGHYGKATPDLYFAVARLDKRIYCDTRPLRAIACLILMMED